MFFPWQGVFQQPFVSVCHLMEMLLKVLSHFSSPSMFLFPDGDVLAAKVALECFSPDESCHQCFSSEERVFDTQVS
jgi:hypothetical protein